MVGQSLIQKLKVKIVSKLVGKNIAKVASFALKKKYMYIWRLETNLEGELSSEGDWHTNTTHNSLAPQHHPAQLGWPLQETQMQVVIVKRRQLLRSFRHNMVI